jgi:hypothetical protein
VIRENEEQERGTIEHDGCSCLRGETGMTGAMNGHALELAAAKGGGDAPIQVRASHSRR